MDAPFAKAIHGEKVSAGIVEAPDRTAAEAAAVRTARFFDP
jgi:hypothetical protein